jgi:hypothetical protein
MLIGIAFGDNISFDSRSTQVRTEKIGQPLSGHHDEEQDARCFLAKLLKSVHMFRLYGSIHEATQLKSYLRLHNGAADMGV